MARKFHIGHNGPGLCQAEKIACPLGEDTFHGTALEVKAEYERRMEEEHGSSTTVSKTPQKEEFEESIGEFIPPHTYVDPYPGKKGKEYIEFTCGNCGGTGIYDAPSSHIWSRAGEPATKYCFKCKGDGTILRSVSSLRAKDRASVKAANEASERAWEMKRDRGAKVAAYEAAVEPDFRKLLNNARDHSGFADSRKAGYALDDLRNYDYLEGEALEEARGVVNGFKEFLASRKPAPEGRQAVTGKYLFSKVQESNYGGRTSYSVKAMFEFDGWRGWGTLPSDVAGDINKGDTLEFTGTFSRSDDDESFAFFSRPAKASITQRALMGDEDDYDDDED